ncbi:MAG TPA: gamma-glutamylcyclotransferase [Ferrovibrio sp.]
MSDREYEDSLARMLADAPTADDIRVFAYGSLIWKPCFAFIEQRIGTVEGWHRSCCLKSTRWRGTPDKPGLMLALEPGGRCRGVVYRLAPDTSRDGLMALWRRELGPKPLNHDPLWLSVRTEKGAVPAITFVANPQGLSYVGATSIDEAADMIAQAAGVWGPCAAYLHETVVRLRTLGIRDRYLWRLQSAVAEKIISERSKGSASHEDPDLQQQRQSLCPQGADRPPRIATRQ